MEIKDWLTLGVSVTALIVAGFSFYYANVHKPAAAVLTMLGRSGSPDKFAFKIEDQNFYIQKRTLISKAQTHISYSLSNTGKQALCIKSVEVLRGPSSLGNLRDSRSFLVIKGTDISSFVLEPGDIKILSMSYENEDATVISEEKYRLFSVEIVSADGARYQICHDITDVLASVSLHNSLWDGVSLGAPVRSDWYV